MEFDNGINDFQIQSSETKPHLVITQKCIMAIK